MSVRFVDVDTNLSKRRSYCHIENEPFEYVAIACRYDLKCKSYKTDGQISLERFLFISKGCLKET